LGSRTVKLDVAHVERIDTCSLSYLGVIALLSASVRLCNGGGICRMVCCTGEDGG